MNVFLELLKIFGPTVLGAIRQHQQDTGELPTDENMAEILHQHADEVVSEIDQQLAVIAARKALAQGGES